MKYLIIFSIVCITSLNAVEIIKKEKVDGFVMLKIKFENHTYVHFGSIWACADSHMWHDPACEYCSQKIEEIMKKK